MVELIAGDGCAAADVRALGEGRDHQIDEAGQDDADADHHQLVFERRPRVGPEKGAQNYGKGVEKPETDIDFTANGQSAKRVRAGG